MALSQDFLYDLHQRNDIVEVIGSYVPLKRKGRLFSALCPFHNEKTPSFVVYPDTQSFYCFGCGAGGDVITFIKTHENLDYIETVKLLAARAGMTMPEEVRAGDGGLRKRILEANKLAARYFADMLNTESGKAARGYLRARKLTDKTIRRFGLGYAPAGWSGLLEHMEEKGFSRDELLRAGLCVLGKNNSAYDFFRDRLMFPVIDLRGNVVAFSGRVLPSGGDPRKYVNTPETPVFKKGQTLFALNFAKNNPERRIILAEGQMDAISLHQAGFSGAVAALGTAFTADHARAIARYADEAVLCYDNDEAGAKATSRVLDIMKTTSLNVRVIALEGAKDVDEYLIKFGAERFEMLLSGSDNAIEYQLGLCAKNHDLETPSGRVQFLTAAAEVLAKSQSPTERDIYAGRVAELAGVAKPAILQQVEQLRSRSYRQQQKQQQREMQNVARQYNLSGDNTKKLGAASAERRLLALVYRDPEFYEKAAARVVAEDFISEDVAAIYAALGDSISQNLFFGLDSISGALEPKQVALMAELLAATDGVNATEQDLEYLCSKITENRKAPSPSDVGAMEPDTIKAMIDDKMKNKKQTKGER